MKFTGYVIGVASLLAPAIASAQDPTPPSAPQAPQAPQTPQTPQTPPAPAPAQATSSQQPVVVVNPNQAQPTAEPAPVAVEEVSNPLNPTVFMTGALVFGASYVGSVIVAGSSDEHGGNHHLYVPIAGPWLDLADRPSCDPTLNRCDHETTTKVLLVADGVFQAAGILTMLDGILDPGSHHVHHSYADNKKVHVVPTTFAGTGGGVNVFGHF